jgi:hypothetical protein
MFKLIDIIGATVIGGFISLILVTTNSQITSYTNELFSNTIVQYEAVEIAKIFENDLHKIGYNVPGNKITIAESNQIKFCSDLVTKTHPEGDGIVDSIFYYINKDEDLIQTDNPLEIPLFRKENNKELLIGRVTSFNLTYYDSVGQQLEYSALKQQINRNIIKRIGVKLTIESSYSTDSTYKIIEWDNVILPRNLI